MGVHVTLRKKIHQKLAVIDEDILWEGSLNILSHYDTVERMTRWQSADMVLEAVSTNGLYGCKQCLNRGGFAPDPDARSFVARQRLLIGQAIAKRRKALHLTQRMLSEEIGVGQKTICSIEAGKRNVQLDALLHILLRLNMGLRAVDGFYCQQSTSS
jgi:DNA-binding XRE family transcriptional regulator